jgi:hypothetical protein
MSYDSHLNQDELDIFLGFDKLFDFEQQKHLISKNSSHSFLQKSESSYLLFLKVIFLFFLVFDLIYLFVIENHFSSKDLK